MQMLLGSAKVGMQTAVRRSLLKWRGQLGRILGQLPVSDLLQHRAAATGKGCQIRARLMNISLGGILCQILVVQLLRAHNFLRLNGSMSIGSGLLPTQRMKIVSGLRGKYSSSRQESRMEIPDSQSKPNSGGFIYATIVPLLSIIVREHVPLQAAMSSSGVSSSIENMG